MNQYVNTTSSVSFNNVTTTQQTLTDATTISWNFASGANAKVTLGGNRTLSISNMVTGDTGLVLVTQDGTGNRTLTLPAGSQIVGGQPYTPTSVAGATDVLGVYFDGTTYWWEIGYYYTPTGTQGTAGIKGQKGESGSQGAQGYQGAPADKGSQGIPGEKGAQGAVGQGTTGTKGDVGPQGTTGAGTKGEVGPKGDVGPTGPTGTTGTGFIWALGSFNTSADPSTPFVNFNGTTPANTTFIKFNVNSAQGPAFSWLTNIGVGDQLAITTNAVSGNYAYYNVTSVSTGDPTFGFGVSAVANQGTLSGTLAVNYIKKGATGPTGDKGAQGTTGGPGTAGDKGATGTKGDTGTSNIYATAMNQYVGTSDSPTFSEVRSTGDIIAYYSSDKRLKNEIKVIPNALKLINKINGYSFVWDVDKQDTYSGKDYGVVAQEIEEIMPELVTTRENGFKAVKYEKIISLLIAAIKEQQIQIDKLNKIHES